MSTLFSTTQPPNSLTQSPGRDLSGPNLSPSPGLASDELRSFITPGHEEGANALNVLRHTPVTHGDGQPSAPMMTSMYQLNQLITNITDTLCSTAPSSAPKEDNPFAVARAEFYISQGLSLKLDGTHEKLAPWIKKIQGTSW
jgi:hypothetical protein